MAARDIVIIGAGVNGLVAAWRLAAAGRKPLVLEARPIVGGSAVTEEFHPGFKVSTLAHAGTVAFAPDEMQQLRRHGLELIHFFPTVFAPALDGRALLLYARPERSAESIAKFSAKDAAKYPEF